MKNEMSRGCWKSVMVTVIILKVTYGTVPTTDSFPDGDARKQMINRHKKYIYISHSLCCSRLFKIIQSFIKIIQFLLQILFSFLILNLSLPSWSRQAKRADAGRMKETRHATTTTSGTVVGKKGIMMGK
jgi:hypothetical protein